MDHLVTELEEGVRAWDRRGWPRPSVLVVSGSGLAVDLPGAMDLDTPLGELLPFAAHAVVGHPHRVEMLEPVPGSHVVYQRGRLHSYQGYSAAETVYFVRLAGLLGARTLVMTNSAGGLAKGQWPGDLWAIRDHLNLSGLNPLRGEPPEHWGPRFPDLVDAYDPALRRMAREEAGRLGFQLGEGVYAGFAGPSFETPAEVAMARLLGADLVGMSTVLEVIAARHLGIRCLCLSLVANQAASADSPVDHVEVVEAGREAAVRVGDLLSALLERSDFYEG